MHKGSLRNISKVSIREAKMGCIQKAKSSVASELLQQVNRKYQFIVDQLANDVFNIHYILTNQMAPDSFTTNLKRTKPGKMMKSI